MDLALTESQRLAREMFRTFADKEVRPRAAEIDRTDAFPREDRGEPIVRAAAEAKLVAAETVVRVPRRARLPDLREHQPGPAPRHRPRAVSCGLSGARAT